MVSKMKTLSRLSSESVKWGGVFASKLQKRVNREPEIEERKQMVLNHRFQYIFDVISVSARLQNVHHIASGCDQTNASSWIW